MTDNTSFDYRHLSTPDDYAECVRLQRVTWGEGFTELVTPVIIMLTQKVGGIAAGAFDAANNLVGFIYGLTGYRDGEPVHWSHMLAVEPRFEGVGVGRRLKELQREVLLERGIDLMSWTFDPLISRNAHLNCNRLGAEITKYVPNMYGEDTGSLFHSGLGTDRFVVDWSLSSSGVKDVLAGAQKARDPRITVSPIVNMDATGSDRIPGEPVLPDEPIVRIEIPRDIEQVKAESMEVGKRWRESTRRAFLWYLERGYVIDGFYTDQQLNGYFYYLVRRGGASE